MIPVAENGPLSAPTLEMETAEFPVFVNVTVCVAMLPVFTVAKLSEVGEAERVRI